MKTLKSFAMIVSAAMLTGCPTMQPSSPMPITVDGAYTHPGTHMVFPESVGQFCRVQVTQFAPAEKDVGIGYNLVDPENPVVATVYVYPSPRLISIGSPANVVEGARSQLFENHLEALKREIVGAHPDATLISEEDITVTSHDREHKGRKVSFNFQYAFGISGPEDATSQLYLFQEDDWLIKYRITFPRSSARGQVAAEDLLNTMEWPKK